MHLRTINGLEILSFEHLLTDKLLHFSTTIDGGISQGNYQSLNLGLHSGDIPECVHQNRERLAQVLNIPFDNLYTAQQTHGNKICIIDQPFLNKSNQQKIDSLYGVDALITNQRHICIAVATADCVPILLFDPFNNVLAAVHAGWKGTVGRIVTKTIEEMSTCFGSNTTQILVGIAPSISPAAFEVGDEVGEAFTEAGLDIARIAYRNTTTSKLHIDLWEANRLQLIEAGIAPAHIQIASLCTYSNSKLFFSARRQTIHSGRMLTGGMLL